MKFLGFDVKTRKWLKKNEYCIVNKDFMKDTTFDIKIKSTGIRKQIEVGDNIIVDKGILGTDEGKMLTIDGTSICGYFGTYINNQNEIRAWDETIHSIRLNKHE